ncbi:hypothetical protein CLOSBL3_20393 [Clostridiaceae bacterium BL-3]|nr:hypothetical protein CLOSBL3_20393 [Clostridiaceae bacterium BL-3]
MIINFNYVEFLLTIQLSLLAFYCTQRSPDKLQDIRKEFS